MTPPAQGFEPPELSDLDHAVYEYLCLRGFNSIAQAFMTSTFHAGGSVPVPMSTLYRFWHVPVQHDQEPSPATTVTAPSSTPSPGPAPSVSGPVAACARTSYSSDKAHACSWPNCTQAFRKRSNLQRHMLLHEGRRPYRCTLTLEDGSTCDKTFARESDLTAHVRVHNGVRPFVCPDCGKKFTRNSDWRSHVKAVHSRAPYTCPGAGCGRRFETLKELRVHLPLCGPHPEPPQQQQVELAPRDHRAEAGVGGTVPVVTVNAPCQVSTCSHNPPPSTSPKRFACSGHNQPSFQVRHEDHIDFLIDGELHHWTDKYCESHGLFSLIDYTPSTTPSSN